VVVDAGEVTDDLVGDMVEVLTWFCARFDEIDAYLSKTIPRAMEWIDSGLDVRFDAVFMAQVVGCIESEGALERLIDAHAQAADMIANMDY
jgi:hypothetical protein